MENVVIKTIIHVCVPKSQVIKGINYFLLIDDELGPAKDYIGSIVPCIPAKPQRHRVIIESQQHTTFKYHFKIDRVLIPVCN